MTLDNISFKPKLLFLSDTDKQTIYDAAVTILEDVGMELFHEDALNLLRDAGCAVSSGNLVKIPGHLVEKARKTVPTNIAVYNRLGDKAMDLGGRRAYFGTGSDLLNRVTCHPEGRYATSLEDVISAARVCDALANIDFIMSFAYPGDLPPQQAYLSEFWAMAQHCVKPVVNTAEGRADLEQMWEISKILRGGESELREKPYWIQYAEPISPLKHPVESVDKLLFCAKTGSPVIYSPAPIAGSTAPMTIAGHVTQGLAESLFGLVMHQLTAPGAPFLMGMGAAVLDMATSQCSYNAPEYLMAYAAMVEISKYLDIPNWGYAGTSDAQIPDEQAVFEGGLEVFLSAMMGSNLNHDVGYLDFGLAGSLELLVVMDEIIDEIRRIQKGIPVNTDTLAVEVVRNVGATGHFLTQPHTIKHMRDVQWRPSLLNRQGFEKWTADGKKSLMDKAHLRLKEILSSHEPEPVEADKQKAIEKLIAGFYNK